MQIRALALDAFGTLIRRGASRRSPYVRIVRGREPEGERVALLTRNVPISVFAEELGVLDMLPAMEAELAEELDGLALFPEVPEVIARARSCGLRLAVCSNLAKPYGSAVRRLLPQLDAYVFSFEVGAAKPDPLIYARVCEALSCSPREVMFAGDSLRCDVEGPAAVGMRARHLDRSIGQSLSGILEDVLRSDGFPRGNLRPTA